MAPSPVVAWLPHCVCAHMCTMHMCAAPTCECVTDRGCLHMPCFSHLCFLFVCCLGGHFEINMSHPTWSLLLSVGWLASKPPGPTCFPTTPADAHCCRLPCLILGIKLGSFCFTASTSHTKPSPRPGFSTPEAEEATETRNNV